MKPDDKKEETAVKMTRETVKIEGDRNLYNCTFEIEPAEETDKRNEES